MIFCQHKIFFNKLLFLINQMMELQSNIFRQKKFYNYRKKNVLYYGINKNIFIFSLKYFHKYNKIFIIS